MIKLCPFCGHKLSRMLHDGITTCDNCNRIFDSSLYHRVLSASWVVRHWHVEDVETLMDRLDLSAFQANYIIDLVAEKGYSHDEFIKKLPQNVLDG